MRAGATALHAPGRAIAPAFWLAAPGQGHASASLRRPPRPPLLSSSRPCAPRAAPAVLVAKSFASGDRFGGRAIKCDALIMGKHGLAVNLRHFPTAQHAER